MPGTRDAQRDWRPIKPEMARRLSDARLQLHHAAQLVSALGISYLPPQSDDSHTNFEWLEDVMALASHTVNASAPVRLAVRPYPFALLVLDGGQPGASLPLGGCTVPQAAEWVRRRLTDRGLDGRGYTLAKHFTIPPHPVDNSAPFNDGQTPAFQELCSWYSNAARLLDSVVARTPTASPVRCWPHHFDIATLIEVAAPTSAAPQKTISLGMEPGDGYYDEPYFYASMYPSPASAPTDKLTGGGSWHTHEWIGAVLPGSRLQRDQQREQIMTFVESAVSACRDVLLS
jgi:hypothetical protein